MRIQQARFAALIFARFIASAAADQRADLLSKLIFEDPLLSEDQATQIVLPQDHSQAH